MTDRIDSETGEILTASWWEESGTVPDDSVTVAFAYYMHEASRQEHWVKHNHLTKPWKASIKERMAESGGLAAWKRAIKLASESDFLCGRIIGKSGSRFKMTLKFMLQPVSFVSILDEAYKNRETEPSRLMLPTLQTPAQKPAEPFKHDIESPEERMAFTIARYRARGKYADGNRVEEQLAALQKRPPVLVPDPTLAWTSAASKPATAAPRAAPVDLEWDMVPE